MALGFTYAQKVDLYFKGRLLTLFNQHKIFVKILMSVVLCHH